ncbi:hypothetical protein [Rhizobium sp. MHM7A]|uniref:hypothetical protein n=1 Tax=Rhizobium sp. MHM7A TaxID=2583233 RepID=UPI0011072491|nr:hypothetical protein [Rhizobium sp. MHM7A]TLX12888.1 hypothetical protein FFR93_13440 [Rhizobium sp. MHM7A]
MRMVGMVRRERGWRDLWLAITRWRRPAEAEAAVEVALRDIDLAAFGGLDGPIAYGIEADRREGRPSRRQRLRPLLDI